MHSCTAPGPDAPPQNPIHARLQDTPLHSHMTIPAPKTTEVNDAQYRYGLRCPEEAMHCPSFCKRQRCVPVSITYTMARMWSSTVCGRLRCWADESCVGLCMMLTLR